MRAFDVLLIAMLVFVATMLREIESKKMHMDEIRRAIKGIRKTCMKGGGVSKELVDAAVNGDFPADRGLQCYQRCVLELLKAMKGDELREAVMIQQADLMLYEDDAKRVQNVVAACLPKATSSDGCERAWEFVKCYYETDKEVYFFP